MLLTDLAKACRKSGLKVVEVDGWRTRGHGPMSTVETIVCHHTAGPSAGDFPSLGVVRDGRPGLEGPLAQLGLGRDGTVYVIAAGVCYHAGEVRQQSFDNWHAIGIEAEATGTSGWPAVQMDAYARLCAALCEHYKVPPTRVLGHKEVCSPAGRKIDPNFDMHDFRTQTRAAGKRLGRDPVREIDAGMWNLRVGRPPATVVREVRQLLDEHDLDVLLVCEAHQYARALRKALKGKYRVGTFWARGGSARDSAVISRKSLRAGRRHLHRLERRGWEPKPGRKGLHWARSAVSRNVAGVRFVAAHTPPGPFGARFPLRKLANTTSFRTLTRLGKRLNKARRPWVAGPDFNRLLSDSVSQAFLDSTGATARGSGIDWVAAVGVQISDVETHDFGTSDHRPKTFTVTKENR